MKKRIIMICIIFLVTTTLFSYDLDSLIDKADELVESRNYLSAFQLLIDSNRDDSIIIAKEVEIALNFAVKSLMHTSFAFKDLDTDETIEELRDSNGDFTMFFFDPREIIKPKLLKGEDGILAKALGDWYYEVYSLYGNTWMNEEENLIKESQSYYDMAYNNDIYDEFMLDRMAHFLMLDEKYDVAMKYLKQAISINDQNANPHYNLAFCYIQKNQTKDAIYEAKKASSLYKNLEYKYDAIVMVAKLSYEIKNFDTSIEYFNDAIELYPKGYEPYTYLIYLYMNNGQKELAKETSIQYFNVYPTEPNVNSTILQYYINFNNVSEYLKITEQLLEDNNDYEILGNLHFYRSFAYQNIKENSKAKLELDDAKKCFKRVFNDEHQVFAAIEDLYKQL